MIWEQKTATIVMLTNLKERKEVRLTQPQASCAPLAKLSFVAVEGKVVCAAYLSTSATPSVTPQIT